MAKNREDKEEEEMERELEKEEVSGEEESLDVSEDEVVDWREAVVDKRKEESFGTGTHSAEDGKTTVVKEVKSVVFPVDLLDFFAFGEKGKSSE